MFPLSAGECLNSLLVSKSAHSSFTEKVEQQQKEQHTLERLSCTSVHFSTIDKVLIWPNIILLFWTLEYFITELTHAL